MDMHLTPETLARLEAGDDFPEAEALAAHLEVGCTACEALVAHRTPAPMAGLSAIAATPAPFALGDFASNVVPLARASTGERAALARPTERLPRWAWGVAAGALAVGFWLGVPTPVEVLLQQGELSQAAQAVLAMAPGPERMFWQARVDESAGRLADAASGYAALSMQPGALRGPSRARLSGLWRQAGCPEQGAAAVAVRNPVLAQPVMAQPVLAQAALPAPCRVGMAWQAP